MWIKLHCVETQKPPRYSEWNRPVRSRMPGGDGGAGAILLWSLLETVDLVPFTVSGSCNEPLAIHSGKDSLRLLIESEPE